MRSESSTDVSLEKLLAHTHDGVFVLDHDRHYVVFNNACERLTGYNASEVVGMSCGEVGVVECRDEQGRPLESTLCPAWSVFKGDLPSARQRMRITTKDGQHRWVETHYTAITGPEGHPEAVIGVMRDMTDAKAREEHWKDTTAHLREELERVKLQLQERYGFAGFVSRAPAMQGVFEKMQMAAGSNAPLLISGESGTGKETVARTIHFNSLRRNGPFVALSSGGTAREVLENELFGTNGQTPGGLYHAAVGGTLFIDEITALPAVTQAKLLRMMQTPVGGQEGGDVRVIAATTRPLTELVSSGLVREDLHYRLAVVAISLPPLRLRKEDLPFLVDHFVNEFNQRQGNRQIREVEPAVWPILESHHWPGNVEELQNTVETALVTGRGDLLRADDLRSAIHARERDRGQEDSSRQVRLDGVLADVERRTILSALRQARGQRSRAAKIMGISRSRLYRRMDALGIVPKEQNI